MTAPATQNILVFNPQDSVSVPFCNYLTKLAETGLVDEFVFVPLSGIQDLDVSGELVNGSTRETVKVLDLLARQNVLKLVRVTAICSEALNPNEQSRLGDFTSGIVESIRRLAGYGQTTVVEVRVFAPNYGEINRPKNYFRIGTSNVILVPEDRPSDSGMPRPGRSTDGWFGAHVGVEVASLIGLWKGMQDQPVDQMPPVNTGVDDVSIRFFRSLVRVVRGPAPPMQEILPEGDSLPVPGGFFPVPDPQWAGTAAINLLFPREFEFYEPVRTDSIVPLHGWNAFFVYAREFFKVAVQIPRTLARGIVGDIEDHAATAAEHLYGESSWIKITRRQSGIDNETNEIDIAAALQFLEVSVDRPNLADTSPLLWDELITNLMSLLDGGADGESIRREIGNDKFILVDRSVISPRPMATAAQSARRLLDGAYEKVTQSNFQQARPEATESKSEIETINPDLTIHEAELPLFNEEVAKEDLVEEIEEAGEEDEIISVEVDGVVFEPKDELDTDFDGEGLEHENLHVVEELPNQDGKNPEVVSDIPEYILGKMSRSREKSTDLLTGLTRKFADQADRSHQFLRDRIDAVANSNQPVSPKMIGVARGVKIVSFISGALFVASLVVLTRFHSAIDFNSFSSFTRARFWAISTIAVIYSASLNLVPRRAKSAQTYVVLVTTLFAGFVGYLLIFFEPLYRLIRNSNKWVGDAPVYLLSVGALVLVLLALIRGRKEESIVRQVGRKILWSIVFLYTYIGLLVGASRPGSPIQRTSVDFRHKLLIFIGIVTIVALITATLAVAIIRVRERNRYESWIGDLIWNIRCAEEASKESRLHGYRLTQWLGSAVALERIFWHPLGEVIDQSEAPLAVVAQSGLHKIQVAELELTVAGYAYFVARIRRIFASQGWLMGQYERAVREFSKHYSRQIGLVDDESQATRPETCSYPEELASALAGDFSSRRWIFADALTQAKFDKSLRTSDTFDDLRNLYSSIFNDSNSYSLNGAGDKDAGVEKFLNETMPKGLQMVPAGISRLAPTALAASAGEMTSLLWMPDSINLSENSNAERTVAVVDEGALLVAVRSDFSTYPTLLSNITGQLQDSVEETGKHLEGL
jgi:hypothetical protein